MTVVPFPTGQVTLPEALIQRFEVRRLIERAWLADVYEVHDKQTRKDGVLKVFRTLSSGVDVSDSLLASIREASLVKHPTFARVYDSGHIQVDGLPTVFVFSELIEDPRLDEVIVHGIDAAEAARILVALIDALHEARRHGSHLALHPGNTMVHSTPHGDQLRIADFGQLNGLVGHLAEPAIHAGSRASWIPPELLAGDAGTTSSDIWCIGALLRFMTTGATPADDHADIPRNVSRVVRSAMATDPRFRYEDLAELKIALEALIVNETFDGYLPPAKNTPVFVQQAKAPAIAPHPASIQKKAAIVGGGLLVFALSLIGVAASFS